MCILFPKMLMWTMHVFLGEQMKKMGEGVGSIKYVSSSAGYYEEVSEDPCVVECLGLKVGSYQISTICWDVRNAE